MNKLTRVISADLSAVSTPPSSRGKLLDGINDDESTASTILSDESQSVASLQSPVNQQVPQVEQQSSPFDRFRNRIASSFNTTPNKNKDRNEDEQMEYLHQIRLRILLKNPEMFRDFQQQARGTETITPVGVRWALYHYLQEMTLVTLLDDLRCEHPEDEDQDNDQKQQTRRSIFSPFGIYSYSRHPSFAPPPMSRTKRHSTGRRTFNDDASVLTFDESLALPSLGGCDDGGDDDDHDDEYGSDGEDVHNDRDGDDCSSIGSRSMATTFSGHSSLSPPGSFSRMPSSWRSLDSRSTSLRHVIYEDEDSQ